MPTSIEEQWKEINASARHWESLVFETAKSYFSVVALSLGGAGTAIAWTEVPSTLQKTAVAVFLIAAMVLSGLALLALRSQKAYLRGFYDRRRDVEKLQERLRLRSEAPDAGNTLVALMGGFWVAIVVSFTLLLVLPSANKRAALEGARLVGADLTAVRGLTQSDVNGACGDSTTKLPQGLRVVPCR